MELSTTMNIQNRPAARQIQPIGFSGRLEAIRAPTRGKARKGKKITSELRAPAVPQVLAVEGCGAAPTYKDETVSAAPTTNMATERAASDHASQAARALISPLFPAALLLLSQHHSTGFPSPDRYENRYGQSELSKSKIRRELFDMETGSV